MVKFDQRKLSLSVVFEVAQIGYLTMEELQEFLSVFTWELNVQSFFLTTRTRSIIAIGIVLAALLIRTRIEDGIRGLFLEEFLALRCRLLVEGFRLRIVDLDIASVCVLL